MPEKAKAETYDEAMETKKQIRIRLLNDHSMSKTG